MLEPFTREQLTRATPGHTERRAVAFQDVDAAGILFYPRFLVYMHDAYVSWLAAIGCPLPELLRQPSWIAPIASVQADFLRPLRFGDVVDVRLVLGQRGRSSFRVGFRIDRGEEPAAVGQTSHVVLVDGRPAPLPERLAAGVEALQAG